MVRCDGSDLSICLLLQLFVGGEGEVGGLVFGFFWAGRGFVMKGKKGRGGMGEEGREKREKREKRLGD